MSVRLLFFAGCDFDCGRHGGSDRAAEPVRRCMRRCVTLFSSVVYLCSSGFVLFHVGADVPFANRCSVWLQTITARAMPLRTCCATSICIKWHWSCCSDRAPTQTAHCLKRFSISWNLYDCFLSHPLICVFYCRFNFPFFAVRSEEHGEPVPAVPAPRAVPVVRQCAERKCY